VNTRPFKFAGVAIVVLAALFYFVSRHIQRSVLFYPSHHTDANGFTPWLRDRARIGYAREVPEPRNVWLFLHGNGGQAADRQYAMHAFDAGDSVYILEYPGYGARGGEPSRSAFDSAALEGYADLRARFPGKKVCVLGESLGSGPASMLSQAPTPPDKIVLVVPFDSITAVARGKFNGLPVGLLLAGTWDNVAALKDWRGPIEIFGAEKDEVIPVRHAQALAASLPQAKFNLLPGNHGWGHQRVEFRCP
jgi:pimeloyl-ACP methyl ester carboxylesterase